jgi:hypothetical protein
LNRWRPTPGPEHGSFTTLLAWDSFRSEEYEGIRYGMKSQSFDTVRDLPRHNTAEFELGMFEPGDVPQDVRDRGWHITNGQQSTKTTGDYQSYVKNSKAEFSVAKHGYVISQCGWFSDRTATYLASGRPAVVQETGFSRFLPAGDGLVVYRDLEEAKAAVEDVEAHYPHHCERAREIAVEYFDSKKVLTDLIDKVA